MTSWDDVLTAITAAGGGRSEAAQRLLMDCWSRTDTSDHAKRCVLAHYLADQQEELSDEIGWDARALREHGFVVDDDLAPVGVPSAAGFIPSLRLNLADAHFRAGHLEEARRHLEAAEAAREVLSDDGYGAMIQTGIRRLRERMLTVAVDPVVAPE